MVWGRLCFEGFFPSLGFSLFEYHAADRRLIWDFVLLLYTNYYSLILIYCIL